MVQYHRMADAIRIFIRAEHLANWKSHLGCIATRMLNPFVAAGYHPIAKGSRIYVQLMKEHEKGPLKYSIKLL